MGFSARSNDGEDYCEEISYSLSNYHKINLWVTEFEDVARDVTRGSSPWYNANYSNPEYNVEFYGKLRVIDLNDYEGEK